MVQGVFAYNAWFAYAAQLYGAGCSERLLLAVQVTVWSSLCPEQVRSKFVGAWGWVGGNSSKC